MGDWVGRHGVLSDTATAGGSDAPERAARRRVRERARGLQLDVHVNLEEVSPMAMKSDVREFFRQFGEAVSAGEASALASAFATPALLISDEGAVQLSAEAEVEKLFAEAAEAYAERGVASTRADVQTIDTITDRLIHAKVRWPYLDSDGNEVGDEVSTYIIWIDGDGRPRIRVALPW
jgi:hypothetical protein